MMMSRNEEKKQKNYRANLILPKEKVFDSLIMIFVSYYYYYIIVYPQNEYEETLLFHLLLFFSLVLLLLFLLLLIDIKLQTIVYFFVAILLFRFKLHTQYDCGYMRMTGIERHMGKNAGPLSKASNLKFFEKS
jgi:hypothetical protein